MAHRQISTWFLSRTARLVVALLIMTPLVIAALYMWVAWDPTRTVDQMPVALVNEDKPVISGSTTLRAGDDVTDKLIDAHVLDIRTASPADAENGLKDGKFYFIIHIPAGFSATIAGLGNTTVAPALISVTYNDNNTLQASNIGARAIAAIGDAVRAGAAATAIGSVLNGVQTLGDGLQSAAHGASGLHTGTTQLTDGLDTLSTALTTELIPGLAHAGTGSTQLADGATELSHGLTQLQGGTDQLGDGAQQIASGIDQLIDATHIATITEQLITLQNQLPAADQPMLGQLRDALDKLSALATGIQKLQNGSHELANQLSDPNAQYRSGLDHLADGGRQLADGTHQLSTGMTQLQNGAVQISNGVQQLSAGSHHVDDGAGALAAGLADGARSVPTLGDATHRSTLAQLLSAPISTQSRNLAPAQFNGPGGAPLYLAVISVLGPLVVFMCLRAHEFVATDGSHMARNRWLARAVAITSISLIVSAAVATARWLTFDPKPVVESMPEVITTLAVAVLMNAALTAVVFSLFGYAAGTLAALAMLMVQLFSFGGVWMVETLPAPLRWLHELAPMTYTRQGLLAGFNGASGFSTGIFTMLAITISALAVCALTHKTGRARYPHQVHTTTNAEQSGLTPEHTEPSISTATTPSSERP